MKVPCEVAMWYVLPFIRRSLAFSLINDLKMSQTQAAKKLGVTDAAISQYLSKKRAPGEIKNERVKKEVLKSAKILQKNDDEEILMREICRLCRLVNDEGLAIKLHRECAHCKK